eukprot:2453982-Rhodomonas_salina.1
MRRHSHVTFKTSNVSTAAAADSDPTCRPHMLSLQGTEAHMLQPATMSTAPSQQQHQFTCSTQELIGLWKERVQAERQDAWHRCWLTGAADHRAERRRGGRTALAARGHTAPGVPPRLQRRAPAGCRAVVGADAPAHAGAPTVVQDLQSVQGVDNAGRQVPQHRGTVYADAPMPTGPLLPVPEQGEPIFDTTRPAYLPNSSTFASWCAEAHEAHSSERLQRHAEQVAQHTVDFNAKMAKYILRGKFRETFADFNVGCLGAIQEALL